MLFRLCNSRLPLITVQTNIKSVSSSRKLVSSICNQAPLISIYSYIQKRSFSTSTMPKREYSESENNNNNESPSNSVENDVNFLSFSDVNSSSVPKKRNEVAVSHAVTAVQMTPWYMARMKQLISYNSNTSNGKSAFPSYSLASDYLHPSPVLMSLYQSGIYSKIPETSVLRLHNEILDFAAFMSPLPEERVEHAAFLVEIFDLLNTFPEVIHDEFFVFGSRSTDITLPGSDWDLSVTLSSTSSITHVGMKLKSLLDQHPQIVKTNYINARVPILALTYQTTSTKRLINADISFSSGSSQISSTIVQQMLYRYPQARPLIILLKYLLNERGLNDTFTGGIGSFLLLNMVVHTIQTTLPEFGQPMRRADGEIVDFLHESVSSPSRKSSAQTKIPYDDNDMLDSDFHPDLRGLHEDLEQLEAAEDVKASDGLITCLGQGLPPVYSSHNIGQLLLRFLEIWGYRTHNNSTITVLGNGAYLSSKNGSQYNNNRDDFDNSRVVLLSPVSPTMDLLAPVRRFALVERMLQSIHHRLVLRLSNADLEIIQNPNEIESSKKASPDTSSDTNAPSLDSLRTALQSISVAAGFEEDTQEAIDATLASLLGSKKSRGSKRPRFPSVSSSDSDDIGVKDEKKLSISGGTIKLSPLYEIIGSSRSMTRRLVLMNATTERHLELWNIAAIAMKKLQQRNAASLSAALNVQESTSLAEGAAALFDSMSAEELRRVRRENLILLALKLEADVLSIPYKFDIGAKNLWNSNSNDSKGEKRSLGSDSLSKGGLALALSAQSWLGETTDSRKQSLSQLQNLAIAASPSRCNIFKLPNLASLSSPLASIRPAAVVEVLDALEELYKWNWFAFLPSGLALFPLAPTDVILHPLLKTPVEASSTDSVDVKTSEKFRKHSDFHLLASTSYILVNYLLSAVPHSQLTRHFTHIFSPLPDSAARIARTLDSLVHYRRHSDSTDIPLTEPLLGLDSVENVRLDNLYDTHEVSVRPSKKKSKLKKSEAIGFDSQSTNNDFDPSTKPSAATGEAAEADLVDVNGICEKIKITEDLRHPGLLLPVQPLVADPLAELVHDGHVSAVLPQRHALSREEGYIFHPIDYETYLHFLTELRNSEFSLYSPLAIQPALHAMMHAQGAKKADKHIGTQVKRLIHSLSCAINSNCNFMPLVEGTQIPLPVLDVSDSTNTGANVNIDGSSPPLTDSKEVNDMDRIRLDLLSAFVQSAKGKCDPNYDPCAAISGSRSLLVRDSDEVENKLPAPTFVTQDDYQNYRLKLVAAAKELGISPARLQLLMNHFNKFDRFQRNDLLRRNKEISASHWLVAGRTVGDHYAVGGTSTLGLDEKKWMARRKEMAELRKKKYRSEFLAKKRSHSSSSKSSSGSNSSSNSSHHSGRENSDQKQKNKKKKHSNHQSSSRSPSPVAATVSAVAVSLSSNEEKNTDSISREDLIAINNARLQQMLPSPEELATIKSDVMEKLKSQTEKSGITLRKPGLIADILTRKQRRVDILAQIIPPSLADIATQKMDSKE